MPTIPCPSCGAPTSPAIPPSTWPNPVNADFQLHRKCPACGIVRLALPPRPNHCEHCAYDLTGNQTGKCPECGAPISAIQRAHLNTQDLGAQPRPSLHAAIPSRHIAPDISIAEIHWLPPWVPITDHHEANTVDLRVHSEIGPGHPLYNLATLPIAQRTDRPHVLVHICNGQYPLAVIELSGNAAAQAVPRSPRTTFYSSVYAWAQLCLRADHAQFGAT